MRKRLLTTASKLADMFICPGSTREERDMFGLEGLLPYEEHGLEMQCDR